MRVGWLGVPIGLLATSFAMVFGVGDPVLWIGPTIAVVGGAILPRPDRWAAAGIGIFLCWLMFQIPNGGADSPLNGIVAICSAGFVLGALLATVTVELRSRLTKPKI
jgi:hypothetical protein